MQLETIGEIKIRGMQSFENYEKVNPVEVSIKDSEIKTFLFKRYKYRLIINNLLFGSSLTKDTNVIFVSCNGLNNAKESLISEKTFKTLGIVNINQIESWDKFKGKSKWVNVVFNDSELDPTSTKHFAFGFTSTNLHDILNFDFSLLDNEAKLINFLQKKD